MINELYKSLIDKEKYGLVEGKIISVFNDNLKSNSEEEIKARQHIIKYAEIPSLQNFYNFKRTNTTSIKFLDLFWFFIAFFFRVLRIYFGFIFGCFSKIFKIYFEFVFLMFVSEFPGFIPDVFF